MAASTVLTSPKFTALISFVPPSSPFSGQVAGGSDFDFDLRSGEARASIGVQYSFRQSVFRSQITSRGEVAGVLEKQLAPGVTFLLSGVMNHAKGESVFGFGLNVGQ